MLVQRCLDLVDECRLAELPGTDVDRQLAQIRNGFQLLAGGIQDPFAQLQNQAGLFGDGNEIDRRDHAFFRVLPAHQGLGADKFPLVIVLRLIMQAELLFFQRDAQVFFHFQTLVGLALHGMMVETDGVAAGGLGIVHGRVRLFQDFLGVGVLPGK